MYLSVGHGEGPVCVDGAPILRAHEVTVLIVGVGPAAAAVAAGVVVGWHVVAGVEGGHHGVLVALEGVVLRAPVVVHVVGVAVPVVAGAGKGVLVGTVAWKKSKLRLRRFSGILW